ncbi:MAG: extracellular solute-binding protein [Atribacteria sp.]|nr:extracellular solute-binding protein [Candidatus Atribacteria bacterium]
MNRKISLWIILSLLVVSLLGMSIVTEAKTLSITYGEQWKDQIDPAIAKFEKATGVKVEATIIPYGVDMVGKVSMDMAAGVADDIAMVDSFMIPAWAEAGYLYPLDDYLVKWSDWNQYFPGMQEIVSFNGIHYAVMIDTDVRMLWYSKPIFKKVGLPIPWEPKSWFDVLDAALTIKSKAPEVVSPFFMPMGKKWAEGTTMQAFYMLLLGADTPRRDCNRLRDWKAEKWIGSSPAIKDALTFYHLVFATGLCPTEAHYVPDVWGEWRRMMREGEIGIGLGGSWEWSEMWPEATRPPEEERKTLLGWVPMPGSGKAGAPEISCISGGWAIGINAKAKDPDLAWKFMEILHTKTETAEDMARHGKIAVRKDATEVKAYTESEYLMEALKLMNYTTYRDTYPGYTKVSFFVQEATEDVSVEGLSAAEAMENFKSKLIKEFGEDKVEVIQ